MAIGDDFSVAVNGDIRHVANTNHYTVLELHRWLQDLADDPAASTGGNDLVDIVSDTPSERVTDQIITLLGSYNIDYDAAKYLYGGSITQASGDTVYSGLRVLGAVNDTDTQLTVVQDHGFYDSATAPFWGTQAGGGYNGNATAGILMRVLIRTRVGGFDIDGQRVRVQARHYDSAAGDSYDFFNVQLGTGESVAAISTTPDAQNTTARATVTAYADVLNSGGTANAPTGGYQLIDINDGSGTQPYYSQWTYGAQGDGMKALYEYVKDLTRTGTAKTVDGISGDLFLGITHQWPYTTPSCSFSERETVVWGTRVRYDDATSAFTLGRYVTVGNAAGKIVNISTNPRLLTIAKEDESIVISQGDTITEYLSSGIASGPTALTTSVTDDSVVGGQGILLATNSTSIQWVQLVHGTQPSNGLLVAGVNSGATASVNGAPTPRTVPKIFLGSYTGSVIGAFGVGIDPDDLAFPDTVQDLDGDTNPAPNNVTFTVSGLVSGDYVLVGTKSTDANDFFKDQMSLADNLSSALTTIAVTTAAIPTDTPSATGGSIRVQNDVGTYRRCNYDSYTTSVFTLSSSLDFNGTEAATAGNNLFVSYIDTETTTGSQSFTSVFDAERTLWIRVRNASSSPIKTFGGQGTLGSGGGSVSATRTADY